MEDVNERFNRELRQQVDGTLPKGHIYELGMPGEILLSAGIPDLPMELRAERLSIKANKQYESSHPFNLADVVNLPNAIQSPIAVFDSKTRVGSKVILTVLTNNGGYNFVVALQMNSHPRGYQSSIEVNSIRSVYPKDNVKDIINWINRGDLLRYADETKILNWLTQQQSNSADVAIPIKDINVATKIIQNFENPIILS